MDTYSQQVGHPVPEIVTGKPGVLGGTEGRESFRGSATWAARSCASSPSAGST